MAIDMNGVICFSDDTRTAGSGEKDRGDSTGGGQTGGAGGGQTGGAGGGQTGGAGGGQTGGAGGGQTGG